MEKNMEKTLKDEELKFAEEFRGKKICVAGIGAIGGLLAGILGRSYAEGLSLIARGKRREALQTQGLKLYSQFYGDSCIMPAAVCENGEELGIQDYVFVCVKNYSLDQVLEQIRPCIGRETVVVPVMNGIEPGDRLRSAFPEARAVDSLIYTVTAAREDFSVQQIGTYTHMFVGSKLKDQRHQEAAEELWRLLKGCGFDARLTEDIEVEIWKKYILNCGFNSVTARYLTTSGGMRKNPQYREDLLALMQEAETVGRRLGIAIPEGTAEDKYHVCMEIQPENATSSLKRDREAGRPMELDAFLGALIRKAEETGTEVPVSRRYLAELQQPELQQ